MTKKQENESIVLFRETLQSEGKSDNTIRNYIADIRHIEKHTTPTPGGTPLYLTQMALKTYMRHFQNSGLSKTTLNRRLYAIRTFFRVMKQLGRIDEDPTEGIRQLSVARQNKTETLERHQVRALYEAIDARTNVPDGYKEKARAIVTVLVNCGLRVQELCDLKMDDIDWEKGVIKVNGKGDKYRIIPFNGGTRKALQRWMQFRNTDTPYVFHTNRSEFMTTRAVQHMMTKVGENLNFKFTVHQLRHTALKRVADATGRIESVAEFAGHDSLETTRRYITPSIYETGQALKETEYDF